MEHSKDFYKIRDWYRRGFYSETMLENLVQKGKITEEEKALILAENEEET